MTAELPNFAELRVAPLSVDQVEFASEAAYDAPELELFGLRWEVSLGEVQGRIYKISLYRGVSDQQAARADCDTVTASCAKLYGKWREAGHGRARDGNMRLWAVEDGYVVLKTNAGHDNEREYFVDVFVTSRAARDFARAGNARPDVVLDVVPDVVLDVVIDQGAGLEARASAGPGPEASVESRGGELARLQAVLNKIECDTGEVPIYIDNDGRSFLHPQLSEELRKPENGWLEVVLREYLRHPHRCGGIEIRPEG